ncbi:MAG: ribosome biogenesis GTP-binding protein YihA/YsxC [Bacteroidetes bacterium]|nr:ribosome biogenesis GTP-binding protein YihA/YsxC [Bacteroidota bacterium]
MFDKQEFIKSVYNLSELPKNNLPEIILCGRSNVGKSSFINSLFNRKNLAKISSTPGKTRSINYYLIDDKLFVVDLPGYGYAKTSQTERKFWAKLIGDFISTSKNISLAFHLIDSRHKPTELDIQLNELLQSTQIPYIVVLTKADKLRQTEFKDSIENLQTTFPNIKNEDGILFYSSVKNTGRKQVLNLLSELFYSK